MRIWQSANGRWHVIVGKRDISGIRKMKPNSRGGMIFTGPNRLKKRARDGGKTVTNLRLRLAR